MFAAALHDDDDDSDQTLATRRRSMSRKGVLHAKSAVGARIRASQAELLKNFLGRSHTEGFNVSTFQRFNMTHYAV